MVAFFEKLRFNVSSIQNLFLGLYSVTVLAFLLCLSLKDVKYKFLPPTIALQHEKTWDIF